VSCFSGGCSVRCGRIVHVVGSVLHRVAPCCEGLYIFMRVSMWLGVCCSVLQCAAVCCSVLQCAAVCCSVLQCVA